MDNFYNLAFERSILNSIIFNQSIFFATNLKKSDFFLEAHQNIFQSMQTISARDTPIDEEFLKRDLERNKKFDEDAMLKILTANPISNIAPYIDSLKKFAKTREILTAISKIKSISSEIDGDELLSQFEVISEKLRDNNFFDAFSIKSMHDVLEEEPEFICKNWIPIPKRTVTIFSAIGGSGKTMAILQLAMRFIEEEGYTKKAFLWLSEDPAGLSKGRAIDISQKVIGKGFEAYKGCLDISDDPTFSVMSFKSSGEGTPRPEFFQMKSKLKEYDLIVIDPLIGFFTGDENNNAQARQFMQLFTQWAAKDGKTIIFVHHSSKGARVGGEGKSRGASAFTDAVRAVYELEKIKSKEGEDITDDSMRKVVLTKDNYNASKYFGFYKELQLFPPNTNKKIIIQEQSIAVKPKQKLIKNRALPSRKSTFPLGANIRIIDEPIQDELTQDQQNEIKRKLKEATAAGLKFED